MLSGAAFSIGWECLGASVLSGYTGHTGPAGHAGLDAGAGTGVGEGVLVRPTAAIVMGCSITRAVMALAPLSTRTLLMNALSPLLSRQISL